MDINEYIIMLDKDLNFVANYEHFLFFTFIGKQKEKLLQM